MTVGYSPSNNQAEALRVLDDGSEGDGLGDGYSEKSRESLPGTRDKVVGEYRILLRFWDDTLLNCRPLGPTQSM